jgi:hypothetical protein
VSAPWENDRWRMRLIEQILAAELHSANDAYLRANQKLSGLTNRIGEVPAPDSNLQLQQAYAECDRTYTGWRRALDRWTQFVGKGIVPEDVAAKVRDQDKE